MGNNLRHLFAVGVLLFGIALVGGTLVSVTYQGTRARVTANQRAALETSLRELVAPASHDNDLLDDAIETTVTTLPTDRPATIYRARRGANPVAAAAILDAANGYGGPITLLVAVRFDGSLLGVRVLQHHETPGLGDAAELRESDWILGFDDRHPDDPPAQQWRLQKDGGVFDQLTGATTTARAIVQAVHAFLIYFRDNRERLFRAGEKHHG
jgi:electron transport complex protein RnfG